VLEMNAVGFQPVQSASLGMDIVGIEIRPAIYAYDVDHEVKLLMISVAGFQLKLG
jgi:hypothetical protein